MSILTNRFVVRVLFRPHIHWACGSRENFVWPERTAILANHSGYLDISMVVGLFPSNRFYTFLAKQELWDNFIGRMYFTSNSCVSVNRDALEKNSIKSIKTIFKESGWVMGLFPEGTRGEGEELLPMKGGAAYITTSNQLDVVPMAIYRINHKIQVVIGETRPYEKNRSKDQQNAMIEQVMHECFDEAKRRFYERWPNESPSNRKRKKKKG